MEWWKLFSCIAFFLVQFSGNVFFFSPVCPYSTTFCKIALYVLTWHFSATTCLKKLRNRLHEFRCLEWAENKAADMNRYERQHLVQSASRRPTCQRDAQFAFMLPSSLSRAQSHTHPLTMYNSSRAAEMAAVTSDCKVKKRFYFFISLWKFWTNPILCAVCQQFPSQATGVFFLKNKNI